MIKIIQTKQVFRNRRFILFTVFIPVSWYFILSNIQDTLPSSMMMGVAIFIGIIGNSLATFSKRVSSNIDFYTFQSRLSSYSIKNYLLDQMVVQTILNGSIFIVVFVFGVFFLNLPLSVDVIIQFILLMIMGIYFSCIGFVLGIRVDSKIIDTVSFPIIIVAALTIVPFSQMGTGNDFINIISKIQYAFPGLYYNNLMNSLFNHTAFKVNDLIFFFVMLLLNLIPVYLLVPKSKK